MLNLRRLLFPTDFSEGVRRAFVHAVSFAARHEAELYILNLTGRRGIDSKEASERVPVFVDALNDRLPAASGDTLPLDVENVAITQKEAGSGSTPKQIRGCIEAEDIDLVVMSTHDRRGDPLLLGSTTEEVLRTAPCPVLTVRPTRRIVLNPVVRRILVPIDGSEASEIAVRHAKEIARTYDAELDLLHTVEQTAYPSAYGVEAAIVSPEEDFDRAHQNLRDRVRDELGPMRVTVTTSAGYPPAALLDYVEENPIDLVVTATQGPSTFDSVTERVIRRSPVPVFTAKIRRTSLVPAEKD